MSTVLLSRATRAADKEKLKTLPRLRTAAARLAAAWTIVMDTPPVQVTGVGGQVTEKVTTVPGVLDQIEQVVSREQLAAAVETVLELLPLPAAGDDDEPFEAKMKRLTATLRQQQTEAAKLDLSIAANLKELGYGR